MALIKGPEVQEAQVQCDQGLRCHQISVSLTTREAFAIWQALWPLITQDTLSNHQNRNILPDGSSIKVPVTAPVRATCLSPNLPLG